MSVSPAYVQCASENGTCTFPGTQSVAYSTGTGQGATYFRNLSNNVACNSITFGSDPSPNNVKKCYHASIPQDIITAGPGFYDNNGNPNPTVWTQCASENGTCNPNVNQPVDILYGANNSYTYANATSTPCNDTIFGGPGTGTNKACYWRYPLNSQAPSQAPIPTPPVPVSPITPVSPIIPVSPVIPVTPSSSSKDAFIFLGVGLAILLIIIIIIVAIAKRRSSTS
jgi:hypothetical protein